MRIQRTRVIALGVLMVLAIPAAATAADQTVEVTVLPADTLSISVEQEFGLGVIVPGQTSGLYEFGMEITNTTSTGWQVTVSGTDLQSFFWDCDEWGENCTRQSTDPSYTIDASAFYVRGGDQNNWGDDTAIAPYEGSLAAAGSPFTLMEGTSVAYGRFSLDEQRPGVALNIPVGAEYADYYGILTYTITGTS